MIIPIIHWFYNSVSYEKLEDGGHGSILEYDNSYAIIFGWMYPRRGSIFTALQQIAVLGGSALIVLVMGYFSCENRPDLKQCVTLPLANPTLLTLTTLCSFVVAFFANTMLTRWWTIRQLIQQCLGGAFEVTMLTATLIKKTARSASTPKERDEILAQGRKLLKHMTGMFILAMTIMLNNARREKEIDHLLNRGVITKKEHAYFMSINATGLHVTVRITDIIHEAQRIGIFGTHNGANDNTIINLHNSLFALRSGISNIGMTVDTQIPYPFVQIVSAVVYCFVIQLFFVCAAFVSRGLKNAEAADLITGILTVCLYNMVLFGLLNLFSVLSNPLGDDAADFPCTTYMLKFEKNLKDIIKDTFDTLNYTFLMNDDEYVTQGEVSKPSAVVIEVDDASTSNGDMESPVKSIVGIKGSE